MLQGHDRHRSGRAGSPRRRTARPQRDEDRVRPDSVRRAEAGAAARRPDRRRMPVDLRGQEVRFPGATLPQNFRIRHSPRVCGRAGGQAFRRGRSKRRRAPTSSPIRAPRKRSARVRPRNATSARTLRTPGTPAPCATTGCASPVTTTAPRTPNCRGTGFSSTPCSSPNRPTTPPGPIYWCALSRRRRPGAARTRDRAAQLPLRETHDKKLMTKSARHETHGHRKDSKWQAP